MCQTEFARRLLAWYANERRRLPWRENHTPYSIWVSEIMLQQTQVDTVIPYYQRWLQAFPTLADFAQADEQEVLKMWEGLGYYSRARNMLRAARMVMDEFEGRIPSQVDQLKTLPGIGNYTAGAIASIAFGADEAALDGNIRRVLSRFFNLSLPARSKEGEAALWTLARENLPAGFAGDYNQAIMDLGATICKPRNPDCENCPLMEKCQAYAFGVQNELPVKGERNPVPHYIVTAAIIVREGQVLVARRPEKGLLGGMWEFPGGKVENGESLAEGLKREIAEELGIVIKVGEPFGEYQHAYTHYKVTLHAFKCQIESGTPQPIEASALDWAVPEDLEAYPMGKIDREISNRLLGEG
jgi:A/G-specific adenine glycosylase